MSDQSIDFQDALKNFPSGSEIKVKLKDGTETTATVRREGDVIFLDRVGDGAADQIEATHVDADDVAGLYITVESEGPE